MRALIIGYGSIGSLHSRVTSSLGFDVAILTQRPEPSGFKQFMSLLDALRTHRPDYIVVSNETSRHYDTYLDLCRFEFTGTVLIEKPVFRDYTCLGEHPFKRLFVGYNLRFNQVIERVKHIIRDHEIISAIAYVGQYLPNWRPGTDYRESYSAYSVRGGGVLRDLSHELDLVTWLLGDWKAVIAHGGQFSNLEICSDDTFALLLETEACPVVTVNLDYTNRLRQRSLLVNTSEATIEVNLVQNTVNVNGNIEYFDGNHDESYRKMHLAVVAGTSEPCSLKEGLNILELIGAAENSSKLKKWITKSSGDIVV